MSSDEVRKLLQQLNPRKAIGDDKIPPALIKIAAEPLSTPLSIAISNSFKHNIFPDNAKVACVKPLDKKTENKHSISNFRPVSILNTFSKIYEKFSKEFLISEIEMFLSPFLAAYRKSYSTQHVLVKMIEKWRENLDNIFFVGAVLIDLSKAFDCMPHDLLIAKLSAYGLSSDSLCYICSYLKDRKQCVQINNKAGLIQLYLVYHKARFLDQFCLIYFLMIFSFLFQKRPFIILQMTILYVVLQKHPEG